MLLTLSKRKDTRGRSTGRSRAGARAHSFAQVDHVSGAVFLPPLRDSAGTLTRTNSRECCASARLSGLYFLDASKRLCRQACRHLSRVHVHLKSLPSSASSSA